MKTLLLDQTAWDLVLDAGGNIALASDPYALAQDAASAIRTFESEVYYDTSQGVPYFRQILGQLPPAQLMKAAYTQAALTVPGVAAATCFLKAIAGRQLSGQVQITDQEGTVVALAVPSFLPPVPDDSGIDLDLSNPDKAIWNTV